MLLRKRIFQGLWGVEKLRKEMHSQITELRERISKLEGTFTQLVEKIGDLDKRIDALDKRIDVLDKRIDCIAKILWLLIGSVIATLVTQIIMREKIDVFIYTYEELVNMMNKGNPLALSALIEGIPIKLSKRIEELKNKAQKMYKRVGRCWVAQLPK